MGDNVPLRYEVIARDLRSKIHAGELASGMRLPAETALAAEYAVSVPTIRQAMGLLVDEGLVEKQHGRGTFVRNAIQLSPTTIRAVLAVEQREQFDAECTAFLHGWWNRAQSGVARFDNT
ncbi:GntR family transcriptional regulator [Kitasatospora sp. NPDC050467]|uniref:GntR family transcriptional regulator n=1 Tax=Kitasatospora sp. NPDC050467 TaxID=3364053 RepID=UPI0037935811